MNRALVAASLATLAALASACGGEELHPKIFSTDWQDDQGKSIAAVQARLQGAKYGPSTTDLVVAVAGAKADKILGVPLGAGSPWTFPHALDARPIITGGLVIGAGGSEVFALDGATGKRLWARPTNGLGLLGASDDGATTVVLLSKGAGSTLLVIGRDGTVRRTIETDKSLGDPAIVGGIIFVPWQNQYVSAIDAQTGDELGRVVLRDKVSQAITIGGGLYFGEMAFVRFDDKIGMASRGGASRVGIPSRELPGSPRILSTGTDKEPAIANARDRDRLYARPSANGTGTLGLDSGRFYAAYYRLVIGFDSSRGNLSWVHTHPTDVIGGNAIPGGLLVCDEDGKIVVLDARTGGVAMEKTFGEPIKSCVANADTFHSPGNQPAGQPLAEQIATAVVNREATLATAQRLLLRELATQEDENATKTLVDIASDPRAAPILIADARTALSNRRNGASFMLAALGKHYDFLRDVLLPPPVGPIADALAAMKDPKAAPLLASHLMDPADTDDDIKRAAAALAALGTKDELGTLRQFFAGYRGTAETDDISLAVASVGEALLRIDTKDGRATVEAAIKDPMTVPVAKARLESLLAAAGEKAPETTKDTPTTKPADKK